MNIRITKTALQSPPKSEKRKYIFVSDNRKICEAIITVGYSAMYISRAESSDFFTMDTFADFVRDTANTGTAIMDYVFVLCCFYKKANDRIAEALKTHQIECLTGGYLLFKDKEYLGKYDYQEELEEALGKFIQRFEGRDAGEVDKLQFCRLDANGVPKGLYDIKIIQYLMDRHNLFVMNRDLYIYRNGCYYLDENGVKIKEEIQEMIPDQFVNFRNLNGLYNLLLDQSSIQRRMDQVNQYPADWINFQNGMFSVREWKLHKHRPDYYAINQIPHSLDVGIQKDLEAYGQETIRFVRSAIPDASDRMMMWQYLGYCMTRDTGQQKMMIIKGVGGTGKSRIISLFQNVIGLDNCSGISLADLNQRFYPSMLYGKLMNACADISSEALMSVDNIKKATGEDIMIYERKGKDPQSFLSYAKLLYSANKIPLNLDEKSNAFYRRLLILEMNQIPKEKDLDLDKKLAAEAGYSIWMAVGALRKLYEDGSFAESANSQRLVEELHRDADTVKAFMDESTAEKSGARIKRTLLYEKYKEYCQSWGRRELSPNSFYKRLDEMGYRDKRASDGWYILNIDLKGEDFLPDEAEEGKKVFRDR